MVDSKEKNKNTWSITVEQNLTIRKHNQIIIYKLKYILNNPDKHIFKFLISISLFLVTDASKFKPLRNSSLKTNNLTEEKA